MQTTDPGTSVTSNGRTVKMIPPSEAAFYSVEIALTRFACPRLWRVEDEQNHTDNYRSCARCDSQLRIRRVHDINSTEGDSNSATVRDEY